MKLFKKMLSVLLCCVVVGTSIPATVLAEDEVTDTREVYLSDLYYAYSYYLRESEYLDDFYTKTHSALVRVNEDFENSKMYDLTTFREAISIAANFDDLLKYATDAMGLTKFTYYDMLNSANAEFAKYLLVVDSNSQEVPNGLEELVENLEQAESMFDTVEEICELEKGVVAVDSVLEVVKDEQLLNNVDAYKLSCISEEINLKWDELPDTLDAVTEIATFSKGLITALVIEDTRIDIVNAIYENAPEGDLKTGMGYLLSQLQNGFVECFIGNYITMKVIDKVCEELVEGVLSDIGGSLYSPLKVITTISEIAATVGFDLFWDIPSVDDLLTQMGLLHYHEQLYTGILNKANSFSKQFDVSDVNEYEMMVNALGALTVAACEAAQDFTDDSNRNVLNAARFKATEDIYEKLVSETKDEIKAATDEELKRVRTRYFDWNIRGVYELVSSNDKIEDGKLYCTDNMWLGDFFFSEELTTDRIAIIIPEGQNITVDGSLDDGDMTALDYLDGWSEVSVSGEFTLNGNAEHIGELICDGKVNIRGNVDATSVVMDQEGTELRIGGSFAVHPDCHYITSGTVILDGNSQQELNQLSVHNLIVDNKQGIKYISDVHVTGKYNLNGNALDNNGNETHLDSDNALLDSVSDYKSVVLNVDYILRNNITCDLYVNKKTLTLPKNSNVIIGGDVTLGVGSNFNVDGSVFVVGDFLFEHVGITSGSTFINMSEPTATFALGGKFDANGIEQCNITNGLVLLAGNTQQEIEHLKAHNVKVENPAGIKYLSDIYVTGRYDLCGNNLENGNYRTVVVGQNVTFDAISNYKDVLVNTEWNLSSNFIGNVAVAPGMSVSVDDGVSAKVDGNFKQLGATSLLVGGKLIIGGDVVCDCSYDSYTTQKLTNSDAILEVKGNLDTYVWDPFELENGTIIFSGTEVQNIEGLKAYNIEVKNKKGIKYESALYFSGEYILNENPLDNGNFATFVTSETAKFDDISDYKTVMLNIPYTLTDDLHANIKFDNGGVLTVEKGDVVKLFGNIVSDDLFDTTSLNVNGQLDVYGDLEMSIGSAYVNMNEPDSLLTLRGDCEVYNCNITDGTVVLSGTETQNIWFPTFATLILNNTSEGGVVFKRNITVSKLFNHNNLQFTLPSNGKTSTFVDYDGDGLLDNVDPDPTINEKEIEYTVIFKNDNGEVISSSIYHLGDTIVEPTVPTKAPDNTYTYEFAGWDKEVVDCSGDATYTATYKAICIKHFCSEWQTNEEGHWGICSRCEDTIEKTEHNFETGWVEVKKPTTTQEGLEKRICSECSREETRKIDKLPSGSWKQDRVGWWYQNADGSYPYSKFQKIDGATYYFNASGYMVTGWQSIGGTWYYFAGSGAMVTGWQSIGGTWYYFAGSGAMVTGWQSIGGTWYYFAGSGAMMTGWQSIGGTWYYFVGSGAMVTGWQSIGGTWYYFAGSGAMVTGWQSIGGTWYYFNGSGAMAADCWVGNYYLQADGSMATNKWIGNYYVGPDGVWIP